VVHLKDLVDRLDLVDLANLNALYVLATPYALADLSHNRNIGCYTYRVMLYF
jgi:hypothetical protein